MNYGFACLKRDSKQMRKQNEKISDFLNDDKQIDQQKTETTKLPGIR